MNTMTDERELEKAAKRFNINHLKNYYAHLTGINEVLFLILPATKTLQPVGHGLLVMFSQEGNHILASAPDILLPQWKAAVHPHKISMTIYKGLLAYSLMTQQPAKFVLSRTDYFQTISNDADLEKLLGFTCSPA